MNTEAIFYLLTLPLGVLMWVLVFLAIFGAIMIVIQAFK